MKQGRLSIRFATWGVLLAAALLAACSSTDKRTPVALEPLTPKVPGRVVWNGKLDGVQFPLAVAVSCRDGLARKTSRLWSLLPPLRSRSPFELNAISLDVPLMEASVLSDVASAVTAFRSPPPTLLTKISLLPSGF